MWDQVGQALSYSMTSMLSRLASLLPGIVALIVALLISALVAWLVAAILRRFLRSVDFDHRVVQWGFPALAQWSPSTSPTLLATRAIAWTIMLIGFLIGISAFDATLTSELVLRMFGYLPNVLAAIFVLAAGSIIARFLARSVLIGAVNMNLQYARLLSAGVKWLVTFSPWPWRSSILASEAASSVWHSAFCSAGSSWRWLSPSAWVPRNSSAGRSTARQARQPARACASRSGTCKCTQ